MNSKLSQIEKFFRSKYAFLGVILLLVNEMIIIVNSVMEFELTQNLNEFNFIKMILNAILLIGYYGYYLRYKT